MSGTPMLLSMTPMYLLGHNHQNQVNHDSLVDVMPLAPVLASHGTNGIENNIISLCRSRQLK